MAKGQMSSKQLMKETARVGCDVSTVTVARPYRRTATAWPGTGATTASTASTATAGWSARNARFVTLSYQRNVTFVTLAMSEKCQRNVRFVTLGNASSINYYYYSDVNIVYT